MVFLHHLPATTLSCFFLKSAVSTVSPAEVLASCTPPLPPVVWTSVISNVVEVGVCGLPDDEDDDEEDDDEEADEEEEEDEVVADADAEVEEEEATVAE